MILKVKATYIIDTFFMDGYNSDFDIRYIKYSTLLEFCDIRAFDDNPLFRQVSTSKYSPFLVNILSIDCELEINFTNSKDFKAISHYNYNAFSIFFSDLVDISLHALINSSKEQKKNRNYPLIINLIKMDNPEIPELNIPENKPIFLYFSDILKKINLLYNNYYHAESPIIISFFIQEKLKFKIKILDDNKKTIIERIIN